MDIYSLCPFRVGTLLWEAQPDQLTLTVTVKATFTLVHGGEATVAPDQDGIGDDRHWDNNALASLYRPGDNAPLKPRVDIVLVGHAHAPGGVPVTSLKVRLRIGDWVKALRVNGDRTWSDASGHLAPGAPAPFTRMPIRYERALLNADNPVGVDPHAPAIVGALAYPNIEPAERGSSAGFGPLASTWRGRRKLLDDTSLFWAYGIAADGRVSAGPAPTGFNFEFFNAAPRDQQIDLLRSGTPIELEHLHPVHPHLETRLPAIRPQVFRVHPRTGRAEEIVLRCDTLWIDGDRGIMVLTFRGLCDLGGADEGLVGALVVAADPQGKKLRFDKVEEQVRAQLGVALRAPRVSSRAGNEALGEADPLSLRHDAVKAPRSSVPVSTSALEPEGDGPTTRIPAPSESIPTSSERAPHADDRSDRTQDLSQLPRRATLPFFNDLAALLPDPPSETPPGKPAAEHRSPLPFEPVRPRPPKTVPPPPRVPGPARPIDDERTIPEARDGEGDTDAITSQKPRRTPPPPPLMPPRVVIAEPVVHGYLAESAPVVAPEPQGYREKSPPAPSPVAPPMPIAPMPIAPMPVAPTMLSEGALAEAARAADASLDRKVAPVSVVAPAPVPLAEPAPEGDAQNPESIPIERYAAISAELSRKGADRAAVLRRHKLTIASWGAVDRRFTRAMTEQTEKGDRTLQSTFDLAYVTAQGQLKKPIGVPEYARILVGLERGEVGRVLVELELQLSDLMRLQRVWTKKLAESPRLAAEISMAVEAARRG